MTILIIDGMNVFIRSFVVVPTTDSDGNPIGGITGFLKSMCSLIEDSKADRVIVAWDGEGGSRRRRGIFNEYKEGRKVRTNRSDEDETSEEQQENTGFQLKKLKSFLNLLGIIQVEASGCEADDVIALISKFIYPDKQKVIVTSDKDMLQLLDNNTIVYSPSKKVYWSQSVMKEKIGVLPENYVIVKALMGDSSDNIPGIGGIGEKTAIKLFPFLSERVSSVEEILKYCDENKSTGVKYKNILEGKELFLRNIELMQLSNPSISANNARTVRISTTEQKPNFAFTEFKLQLIKSGIQFVEANFMTTMQIFKMRSEKSW